jgi:hypothetical protein
MWPVLQDRIRPPFDSGPQHVGPWLQRVRARWPAIAALAAYSVLALVATWPLALHLGSRVTGPVGGDTGVYVWNIWLFRHEIVAHGHSPFLTGEILSLTPDVDLSLHNYTTFANLLAFPLIPHFGVVTTFNLVYLAMVALSGWTMYLLARSLTVRPLESWLAGALFTASPVLMTRGTGHFSLVAAMPLPVFAWCALRAADTGKLRYGAAAGVTIAWATLCDVYFGVFCLLFGAVLVAAKWICVRIAAGQFFAELPSIRVLDGLMLAVAGLIAGILVTGGMSVQIRGMSIAMRSLYNPVFALTLLMTLRVLLTWRPRLCLRPHPRAATLWALLVTTGVACVVPLSPVLYAVTVQLADGGTLHGPTFWRSSPPGVDLLAMLVPNPNHAVFGAPYREWLSMLPNGYVENVASIPIVALLLVLWVVWRHGFRPPIEWLAVCVIFGALALGPFVHIGGANTYVPGPWALLRYVPLIGAARTPARFTIVMMVGFSAIFALALAHLTARRPERRRVTLAAVGALLLVELVPAPRTLYSAELPEVYRIIASDPRDVRVLNLPFGIRDGESSLGNFTAASQFYQTFHEKPLVGGYLSRISRKEKRRQRQLLVIRSLIRRSEGKPATILRPEIIRARGRAFVRRQRIGYVVIDTLRATSELREYAVHAFDLQLVAKGGGFELYRPKPPRDPLALANAR